MFNADVDPACSFHLSLLLTVLLFSVHVEKLKRSAKKFLTSSHLGSCGLISLKKTAGFTGPPPSQRRERKKHLQQKSLMNL